MIRKLWYFFLIRRSAFKHMRLAKRYAGLSGRAYSTTKLQEMYMRLEDNHMALAIFYLKKAEELFDEQAQEAPRAG